jgi:hypothetical protein
MSGWKRPETVFQHLLREEDAIGLEARDLIREASEAKARAYLAMGGGFSCWYRTKLRSQRINPYMSGDFLGDVSEAARASGLRLIARVDLSKGRPEWIERDPDWFVRGPDGAPSLVWEMPATCPTGPFWQQEAFSIVGEMMQAYRPDGLFFNYLYVPRCYCGRCAATVRAATGADIPAPGTRSAVYEGWRRGFLTEFVARLGAHARSFRSDVAMIPYHHVRDGWDAPAMAGVSDVVSSQISNPVVVNPIDPQPQWAHWAAEEAMLARGVKPDAAPLLVQTASGFFASRQTAMPPHRMLRNMAEANAFGASVMVAVSGRLGGDDPRAVPAIRAFGELAEATAPWLDGAQSVAKIAVLRSQATIDYGPDNGRLAGRPDGWGHVGEARGIYSALMRLRRPADILPAEAVDPDMLARYPVVIAPALSCLSQELAGMLETYVAAGGTLVATGDFGARDEVGERRTSAVCAALPALPGESRPLAGAYFAADRPGLSGRIGGAPHLGAEGPLWMPQVAPDGCSSGMRVIGPFRNNAPEFAVVRGPGTDPGLLERSHGRGRAIWLPWLPGAAFGLYGVEDHAVVLEEVVESAAGPAPIRTDAPAAVSFSLTRNPKGWLLHVFNDAAVQGRPVTSVTPLAGFDVTIDCPVADALDVVSGAPFPIAREMGRCKLRLDRLETYQCIALLG